MTHAHPFLFLILSSFLPASLSLQQYLLVCKPLRTIAITTANNFPPLRQQIIKLSIKYVINSIILEQYVIRITGKDSTFYLYLVLCASFTAIFLNQKDVIEQNNKTSSVLQYVKHFILVSCLTVTFLPNFTKYGINLVIR